jgi:hypothetical protein
VEKFDRILLGIAMIDFPEKSFGQIGLGLLDLVRYFASSEDRGSAAIADHSDIT